MTHWSFLFKYSMVAAWWQCWWHSRHSEARTGTWILQKPEQRYLCFSWINQDHIYQIRNNWLGPIFFSPGDTFTKGILVLLHPGFDNVNDMTQIQKADLCFSRWLLLITGFSVSMLLRGMAIENNKGTLLWRITDLHRK